MIEKEKERAYDEKLKQLEYRYVNKKTYSNKKYDYTVVSTYVPSSDDQLQKRCKGQNRRDHNEEWQ